MAPLGLCLQAARALNIGLRRAPEAWSLRSENLKLLRPLQAILQI